MIPTMIQADQSRQNLLFRYKELVWDIVLSRFRLVMFLAVFLHRFLKFLKECEFSIRPIFAQHVVFLVTLDATNFARNHHLLHYGIQQAAQ